MKTTLRIGAIAIAAIAWPLSAQVTEKKETTETKEHADGSVTETKTETTRTFHCVIDFKRPQLS